MITPNPFIIQKQNFLSHHNVKRFYFFAVGYANEKSKCAVVFSPGIAINSSSTLDI